MELSLAQIQERTKNPKNRQALLDAVDHENRIKLHTKAVDKIEKASPYFTKFLQWVEQGIKLPADKMSAFKGMCQPPFVTTPLCNSIFDEYEKIFHAQDPYFDVEVLDDSLKADFKAYLHDTNFFAVFREKAFEAYKTSPATIFVIDMPAVQTSLRPQPYWHEVDINDVIELDFERSPDGEDVIALVIFSVDQETVVAIDGAHYRMLKKQQDGEYLAIMEAPHGLGYTPATFLPHTPLYGRKDKSPVTRKVIMSNSLHDLDWLLFYKIAGEVYETFGPFPIMTVPETNCTFADASGNRCSNGVIPYYQNDKLLHYDCPACAKNNMVGPGTIFSRPIPRSKEDPKLDKPVEITPADIPSLEYISNKIDFLEWQIYENNVGSADEQVTKEAVNEKQVQATVESKRNILHKVKKDFEKTEKFIVDTMGRLMYGDYYVGCTDNYGDQFFLFTPGEVTEQYAFAKKSGLPNYLLAQKKQLLIQTEHKNNPYLKQRSELMNLLEPWPDMALAECMTYQLNVLYPEKFLLKLDIANFVSKFELQNGDIVTWGSALSLDQKVTKLTETLLEYARTDFATAKPIPEPGESKGGEKK